MAKHIHKYQKKDIGSYPKKYYVYKCIIPACPHYVSFNLAEGKLAICHGCNEPFIISKATLTGSTHKPMAKPKCSECIKRKKPVVDISNFLKDKGI